MPNTPPGVRVLVVDDEVVIADTLAEILKRSNYDVFRLYSAEEAVLQLADLRPDVVITDVVMGPMNGVELAKHITSVRPDCKVLLISGHTMTSGLIAASEKNGYTFPILAKPFHPKEILDFLACLCPSEIPNPVRSRSGASSEQSGAQISIAIPPTVN